MPPKGASTRVKPIHLASVKNLQVRRPDKEISNPCMGAMSAVLSCWASSGYSMTGCVALEHQLRLCMDKPKSKNVKRNTINYHLSRLWPQISGPRKKTGPMS